MTSREELIDFVERFCTKFGIEENRGFFIYSFNPDIIAVRLGMKEAREIMNKTDRKQVGLIWESTVLVKKDGFFDKQKEI